jgi:hypothetical protein
MSHNSRLKDLELQKPPLPIKERTQGAGEANMRVLPTLELS